MNSDEEVERGPELRATLTPELAEVVQAAYGIENIADGTDLGGSSNLNLLVRSDKDGYVLRVYRPWVTAARLADIQSARRTIDSGGVSSPQPILTRDDASWTVADGRLVELEPFVPHDTHMDSWERLEGGLPLLGRIHTLLRPLQISADGRQAPASNNVDASDALSRALGGVQRIRQWHPSSVEQRLADDSEQLARLVNDAERDIVAKLPRQLVHGDFWDNNVFFRKQEVVLVTDFDFMGERPRIDDLALTLYYTNSTFADDQLSENRRGRLRRLIDAYDSGLDDHLTSTERAALPLALARAPLCFVAMIASLKTEQGARRHAAEMTRDVEWALAIAQRPEPWQDAFA